MKLLYIRYSDSITSNLNKQKTYSYNKIKLKYIKLKL